VPLDDEEGKSKDDGRKDCEGLLLDTPIYPLYGSWWDEGPFERYAAGCADVGEGR